MPWNVTSAVGFGCSRTLHVSGLKISPEHVFPRKLTIVYSPGSVTTTFNVDLCERDTKSFVHPFRFLESVGSNTIVTVQGPSMRSKLLSPTVSIPSFPWSKSTVFSGPVPQPRKLTELRPKTEIDFWTLSSWDVVERRSMTFPMPSVMESSAYVCNPGVLKRRSKGIFTSWATGRPRVCLNGVRTLKKAQ